MSTVILVEKGGTGLSRGCAFVSFAKEVEAQAAIAALDNQLTLPNAPYNLRVGSWFREHETCCSLSARPSKAAACCWRFVLRPCSNMAAAT